MSKWFVTIDWLRDNWFALSINNSRCDFEDHVKKITTTCLKHDRRLSTKKLHDDDSRRYTSDFLNRKFYYDVNKILSTKVLRRCKSYFFFFSSIENFACCKSIFSLQLEILIISSINDVMKSTSTISSLTRELSINYCSFICRLRLLKVLRSMQTRFVDYTKVLLRCKLVLSISKALQWCNHVSSISKVLCVSQINFS